MSSRASLNHIYRTVWNQALGAMVAVAEIASGRGGASSSSAAGAASTGGPGHLLALALGVALAWGAVPPSALANPTGGVAVAGKATMVSNGSNLVVTTQNAVGTNHSTINWQSFSVPQGSTTYFQQPTSASTSINRVVTNTPTQLFGTLGSNGNLVLVNQAGITVGAGAVVDTAGFTASSLNMTDADALAGRLRFGDGSASGAAVDVQGKVLARNGDVVLIGSGVSTGSDALIQAPNGATVLAAGQQVELTGRGLEGISLQVQAPENTAVNLGTLQGGAAGIFAGTLKHSGLIQANTLTMEGGRVVLKAAGDAMVQGGGRIEAKGTVGGSVDVFGKRVGLLDQASIDVSGANGGGQIRVGGDYQGKNAEVPNAEFVYVSPQTTISADATTNGDGGRVIVWADEATRAHGAISAQGGSLGGDGGFVETSGKNFLNVTGARVNTSAPSGKTGVWLLDPNNLEVVPGTGNVGAGTAPSFVASALSSTLGVSDLLLALDSTAVSVTAGGNLTVTTAINDSSNATKNNLTLTAQSGTLSINGAISLTNKDLKLESQAGSISLNADLSVGSGEVQLKSDQAISQGSTNVITASKLSVESTGTTGGNVSLTGTNMVGTFAASRTNGAGGLSLVNGQSLTVGTVGSVAGVTLANNAAGISISTTTGNLTINEPVLSGGSVGGQISLSAANGLSINKAVTSQTSTVPVGPVILAGGTGISSHFTDGIITTAGLKATSGCCINLIAPNVVTTLAGSSVGNFTFHSAGNFSFGTVASTTGVTTNGGNLSVTSGGTLTTGDIATAGGNLTVTASGLLTLGQIATQRGNVTLSGSSVTTNVVNTTYPTVGGDGGSLTITATSGNVSANTINTNGVNGSTTQRGSGGNVTVSAVTGITLADIVADGDGNVAGTPSGGGTISVSNSGTGNVSVGNVFSRGTTPEVGQNRSGGSVSFTASDGSVVVTGKIDTNSGAGGGNITLVGKTGVNIQGELNATGGSSPANSTVTLTSSIGSVTDTDTNSFHAGFVVADKLVIASNGITLEKNTNNVASLSITPAGTMPISYWDADDFSIGALTFSGTYLTLKLKSSGGNITQTGPLIANGSNSLTTLTSGAGSVTLTDSANDFAELEVTGTTGAVNVRDANAIYLNGITAGSFGLVAGGDVTVGGGFFGISTSAAGGISVSTTAGNISVGEGVTAALGNIDFSAGGTDKQFSLNSFFSVQSSSGNVSYVADNVALQGNTISGTGAGKFIEIKPFSAATAIEFAPPTPGDAPGFLRLSSAELGTLTTPMLKVGNSAVTGGISIKESLSLSTVPTLSLITGGAISQDSGRTISVLNLNADGAGGVTLTEPNSVTAKLAGRTSSSNAFRFTNAGSLNIDQVDVTNNGIVLGGSGSIVLASGGAITQGGTSEVSTSGSLQLNASTGITLKTKVSSLSATNSSSGDIALAHDGAGVLSLGTMTPASSGRWLIFAANPASLTKGSVTSTFRKYNTAYNPLSLPTELGNGFIYASAPGTMLLNTTLSSGSASNVYGVAPDAVFGLSSTFPVGADSEDIALATTGTPTFTQTFSSLTNAGSYTNSYASGKSHPVYAVAAGTGLSYTVNQRPVSLTGTRAYDASAVVNGSIFTLGGLVPGQTLSVTGSGTVPDKNVGASQAVTLDSLALVNGTGLASNYTLSGGSHFASFTTVPLTITANNSSKEYNGITGYTGSAGLGYSGFVGGESPAVLGGTLSFGGTSQTALNAGSYTIVPSGLTSTNYSVSYVNGSLTITPVALAVTGSLVGTLDKVYNGNTAATLVPANFALSGFVGAEGATVTKTAGTYAQKDVGSYTVSTTLAVGDFLPIGATVLSNYTLPTAVSGTGSITPKPLTATATAPNKVYDGNTAAAPVVTIVSGLVGSETVTATASGTFNSKDVLAANTVTVNAVTLANGTNGGLAGNYSLATGQTASANITPASLTITALNKNKTYDNIPFTGGNGATYSGFVGGENSTALIGPLDFSGTSQGAVNNGTYTIVPGGLTSDNYLISYVNASLVISPSPLTVVVGSLTGASSKVYDGNSNAQLTSANFSLNGFVAGQGATVTKTSGTYASSAVGSGIPVFTTLTSGDYAALAGTNLANYILPTSVSGDIGVITQRALSLAGLTAVSKVYDGSATANLTGGSLQGAVLGDRVSLSPLTATFDNKNVGRAKPVTLSGLGLVGADAGNYRLNGIELAADITPLGLSVTGISAANKVYDGTTKAELTGGSVQGVLANDVVSLTAPVGSFDNKNVGSGKVVTVTGLALGGADAGNYTLGSVVGTVSAEISAKPVSVSSVVVADKTYDGSKLANVTNKVLVGALTNEQVDVASILGEFSDKNAGQGKPVTVTFSGLSGVDSGNYRLETTSLQTTASIDRRVIGAGPLPVANKVYDGTLAATLTGRSLVGAVPLDDVGLLVPEVQFATKDVGDGKVITVKGLGLSGIDAGNYRLSATEASTTANITPKGLTITAVTAADKVYDGNTTVQVSGGVLEGAIEGDRVSLSAAVAAFDTKDVGTNKTVTVTGLVLSGADLGNYKLAAGNTATQASITAKPLTISELKAVDKVYDGNVTATISGGSLQGAIPGDDIGLSAAVAKFSDKNAGVDKLVEVSGLSLSGADLKNYTLAPRNATDVIKATITQKDVAVSGLRANEKEYDGKTDATLSLANAVLNGLIGSDVVTLTSAQGAFETKDIGVGKTVKVTAMTFAGADAGNYRFGGTGTATGDIKVRTRSNWTATGGGLWSDPTNWDVLPDGANVLEAVVPAGAGTVTFDTKAGLVSLQSINSSRNLAIAGGDLQVATGITTTGLTQTGGAAQSAGSLTVNGALNQTGGSLKFGSITVTGTPTTGDLTFSNLVATSVTLSTQNGAIRQTGPVLARDLTTNSTAGTFLAGAANQVSNFKASNQGSGSIELTNVGPLVIDAINNVGGSTSIVNTGGVSTVGLVASPSGNVSITANSPLSIGPLGVKAGGNVSLVATNLTSAGNLTIDGPIESASGAVVLSAGSNLTQNSSVSAPLGVKANAGGAITIGPLATSGFQPVTYQVNSVPVIPPRSPESTTSTNSLVVALMSTAPDPTPDRTVVAIESLGSKDKDKERDLSKELIVSEGQICRP